MKISVKISLLMGILLLAFAGSLLAGFLIRKPLHQIESEAFLISTLQQELMNTQMGLGAFYYKNFREHKILWEQQVDVLNDAFTGVGNIVYLPSVNSRAADSVEQIKDLHVVLEKQLSQFKAQLDEFEQLIQKTFSASIQVTFTALYQDTIKVGGSERYMVLISKMNVLEKNLASLQQTLQSSTITLAKQEEVILGEVALLEQRSWIFAGVVGLILISLSLILSALISLHITRNITILNQSLRLMANKDLSQKPEVKAGGELGELANHVGLLSEHLRASLNKIKGISDLNVRVKDELVEFSEETFRSAQQIKENTDALKDRIQGFSTDIEQTGSSVVTITERVAGLHSLIHDQMSMVTESSAAVEQMIASIQSISDQTEVNRGTAERLEEISRDGEIRMDETNSSIQKVSLYVGDIEKMVKVINGIAQQTNLLAMNAAIEAAHAGSTGRGFNVVAGEVRSLAEETARNSVEIRNILNNVTSAVEQASRASETTRESFTLVSSSVRQTLEVFQEMNSSMRELSQGSQEILTSISGLTETSQAVEEGADQIREEAVRVEENTDRVVAANRKMESAVEEIATEMEDIHKGVSQIVQMGETLGNSSDDLSGEVQAFKTEINDRVSHNE